MLWANVRLEQTKVCAIFRSELGTFGTLCRQAMRNFAENKTYFAWNESSPFFAEIDEISFLYADYITGLSLVTSCKFLVTGMWRTHRTWIITLFPVLSNAQNTNSWFKSLYRDLHQGHTQILSTQQQQKHVRIEIIKTVSIVKLWIYEIHIFELRNEEINVKKILAVINALLMQLRKESLKKSGLPFATA